MAGSRNKITVGAVAAFAVAVSLAVPAQADTSEQDRQFLSALRSAGWAINSASTVTRQGHMVCNEGLAHGVSVQEMRTTLMSYGYSSLDASTLIRNAVSVYCPDRDDALTDIENGSNGSGAKDPGELFVEQLRRKQGISIDKDAAVDMAQTACKVPLAGVGLYNAWQAMQQRYPEYNINVVAAVMANGVVAYCPERMS